MSIFYIVQGFAMEKLSPLYSINVFVPSRFMVLPVVPCLEGQIIAFKMGSWDRHLKTAKRSDRGHTGTQPTL